MSLLELTEKEKETENRRTEMDMAEERECVRERKDERE